ncbi:MAG: DUF1905 domain-containing protein [Solirubrobacteraceae bacterium]|nr:DUF1905 domain-containing protein [Solirubrobacteraceae bacterium]
MADPVTIRATLHPRGPAAAVILTDAQLAEIGQGKKTPAVKVTVNGAYTFDGRIGRMGGETLLGFNKAVRTAAGVEPGDELELTILLDDGPREVELPADLAAALASDPATQAAFEALAYSHRKEFARWVGDAKKPETREKRIAETLEKVAAGLPPR